MQRLEDKRFAAVMQNAAVLMETKGWTWWTALAVAEAREASHPAREAAKAAARRKPPEKGVWRNKKGLSVWERLASEATKELR